MNHASPAAPHETVLGLLASSARSLSFTSLAEISLGAGAVAALAAITGLGSWQLLSGCYLVWCFAAWGTLFHDQSPRAAAGRLAAALIAGSGICVFATLFVALFFGALGPRWML